MEGKHPAALRVAAYCRVSTDKDDQLNSLAAQRQFFQEYIQEHPGWVSAGIFADGSVKIGLNSGTRNSKGRRLPQPGRLPWPLVFSQLEITFYPKMLFPAFIKTEICRERQFCVVACSFLYNKLLKKTRLISIVLKTSVE